MGLPAPLLDAFSELEQIAAEEDPRAPIEVLTERTRKIEGVLKEVKVAEIFAEIERSARMVGLAGQAILEQTIEQLYAQESAFAARFKPMIQATRDLRAKTFRARHLNRPEKAKHVLALERHAKALVSVLNLFRDERWRMMALLAETESADGAPSFRDPKELEDYLDKL
jgi:hypothetical protein